MPVRPCRCACCTAPTGASPPTGSSVTRSPSPPTGPRCSRAGPRPTTRAGPSTASGRPPAPRRAISTNYYIASHRSHVSYDQYLAHRARTTSASCPSEPDWVEHFSYEQGLLVSYWDTSQSDNNTSEHPGEGLILPIDAHPRRHLQPGRSALALAHPGLRRAVLADPPTVVHAAPERPAQLHPGRTGAADVRRQPLLLGSRHPAGRRPGARRRCPHAGHQRRRHHVDRPHHGSLTHVSSVPPGPEVDPGGTSGPPPPPPPMTAPRSLCLLLAAAGIAASCGGDDGADEPGRGPSTGDERASTSSSDLLAGPSAHPRRAGPPADHPDRGVRGHPHGHRHGDRGRGLRRARRRWGALGARGRPPRGCARHRDHRHRPAHGPGRRRLRGRDPARHRRRCGMMPHLGQKSHSRNRRPRPAPGAVTPRA